MTNPPPVGAPEPQWQQPAFGREELDAAQSAPLPVAPAPQPVPAVIPAAELVPPEPALPPSVAETTLATVAGLIWPVVILLALTGYLSWWPAILVAIVTSVVTDNIRKHLRQRRRALGAPPGPRGNRELR